jgi:hypothetical protein
MSKLSRKQQFTRLAEIAKARRTGKKPPNYRKDGGLPTKPSVPCNDVVESVVQEECYKWLNARCSCERNNTGLMDTNRGSKYQFGMKGNGDLICCHRRIHVEIECKKGKGGVLSPNQQEKKAKIEENGGIYMIVHGLPELKEKWNELNKTINEWFNETYMDIFED